MLTQSPAAGIGPGQTTAKPFSPRDVKAHIMSAGALPRFGGTQATPESPASDALIKTTEGEQSQQKAVKNATRILDNFMGRLRRFIHAIKKAFRQLLGHETPKSPAKQLAKLQVQDLVQLATQDKRMDETLKRLSKTPGGEALQTHEGREQFKEQVPALMIYSINQSLNHDEVRDITVGQLLHAVHAERAESAGEEPAEAALDDTPKPAKPTEEGKTKKAEEKPSSPASDEPDEAPSPAEGGLLSVFKNMAG